MNSPSPHKKNFEEEAKKKLNDIKSTSRSKSKKKNNFKHQ